MKIKNYVDNVQTIDFEEIKNLKIEDLIYKFHKEKYKKLYVLKENKPNFVLDYKKIVELFINNQIKKPVEILLNKDYLKCFDAEMNIIDTYYQMRKENLEFVPVCENGKIIGEIDFNILSLKIFYIVVKDELTGVFNKTYFDVIIEEYNDFKKPIGIIFIEIQNLPIYEGLYGVEITDEILKDYAKILSNTLRDIDLIFRVDNQFRIVIFNTLEVTIKIIERIKNKLDNLKIKDIHIAYKISFSHIPEMYNDIISAIEDCERQLIERD